MSAEYKRLTEKYYDIWDEKNKSYGQIENGKPIAIFLDGKDVTKHHDKYPMIGKYNFTEMMMHYGYELVSELDVNAVIYASMDEMTIIFTEPERLLSRLDVDNRSCVGSILVLKFAEKFWKYKKVYFKNTVFNINAEDIERWVNFRREAGYETGTMYVAKEYLPKEMYKDKPLKELEQLLDDTGLLSVCQKNKYIREGYYKEYKRTTIADAMSDFIENYLK